MPDHSDDRLVILLPGLRDRLLKILFKSKRASTNTQIWSSATNLKRKKIDYGLHSSLNPMSQSVYSTDDEVSSFIRPENQANVMAKIQTDCQVAKAVWCRQGGKAQRD